MKQKIKAILDEDRGVSPVIGVILMVAITVILAAVIGTFVLGLGDSLEQAPQAQLQATSDSPGNVTISHQGGDQITASEMEVTIADNTSLKIGANTSFSGGQFSVGDSATFINGSGTETGEVEVQIVHVPSESIILDTEVDVGS